MNTRSVERVIADREICKFTLSWAVNIEPAIYNGYLPYPWGRPWWEVRVGSWTEAWGSVEQKRSGLGRVRRLFSIDELVHGSP